MFKLDAWLERRDPMLRIVDEDSDRTVAEWQGEALQELLESGVLSPGECQAPRSRDTVHELIRELILESCLGGITVQRRSVPSDTSPPRTNHRRESTHAEDYTPSAHGRPRQLACPAAREARSHKPGNRVPAVARGRVLHVAFRRCTPPD
ncbi:hypothetical protein [Thioalkalivibrio sp. ALJ7]|uniref:hypothetical protein n=1 Tax=Thioalkalivibrio sp. ALJ7 TaxID=1158756 RepID=UPI0003796FD9|nr:hypothetical protein [Thioalkalivibrio sp. ALJ7]